MKVSALHTWRILTLEYFRMEWRSKLTWVHSLLFGSLVIVVASISFFVHPGMGAEIAPGVLWLAIAFSGTLLLTGSWSREREMGALWALQTSQVPGVAIYLAKVVSTSVVLCVMVVWFGLLSAVLLQVPLSDFPVAVWGALLLGALGWVAAGHVFAAVTVQSRARDLVLTLVLFPLLTPSLLAGTVATRALFQGAAFVDVQGWFGLQILFDGLFLTLGSVLFDPLTRE